MASSGSGSQGVSLEGHRVLIIEDEMLVAMELESLLHRQGCAVLGPATSVARAMALLDEERPDAALLDLNLNGQPSVQVAEALAARDVPFLLVTGYGEGRSLQPELQRAPRVDKPVNHRQLIRSLTQLLEAGPN